LVARGRNEKAVAVTLRKALRWLAAQLGELLLFIALVAAWFFVWGVVGLVTGVRAAMYQNYPVSLAVTVIGMTLILGSAWLSHRWIKRRWRARGKPQETQEGG
jgi:uncharacterized membrane protein HdeD (DUF308 family)